MSFWIGFKNVAESVIKLRIGKVQLKWGFYLGSKMMLLQMAPFKGVVEGTTETVGLESLDCGFAIGPGAKSGQLASRFFVREPGHHIAKIENQCFHGEYLFEKNRNFPRARSPIPVQSVEVLILPEIPSGNMTPILFGLGWRGANDFG